MLPQRAEFCFLKSGAKYILLSRGLFRLLVPTTDILLGERFFFFPPPPLVPPPPLLPFRQPLLAFIWAAFLFRDAPKTTSFSFNKPWWGELLVKKGRGRRDRSVQSCGFFQIRIIGGCKSVWGESALCVSGKRMGGAEEEYKYSRAQPTLPPPLGPSRAISPPI